MVLKLTDRIVKIMRGGVITPYEPVQQPCNTEQIADTYTDEVPVPDTDTTAPTKGRKRRKKEQPEKVTAATHPYSVGGATLSLATALIGYRYCWDEVDGVWRNDNLQEHEAFKQAYRNKGLIFREVTPAQ